MRDAKPHEEPEPRKPDDRAHKGLRSSHSRIKGSAKGVLGRKRCAPQREVSYREPKRAP